MLIVLETTSYIDITSSYEITSTKPQTTDGPTTTESDILGTTSAYVLTNTDTSVDLPTLYIRPLGIVDF